MNKQTRGFTLLELLIVMTIIVILFSIGIPSYQHLVEKHRVDMTVSRLYRAIQLARSEAIKHNVIVTLCPSRDGKSCSGEWEEGYIVFVDRDGNGQIESENFIIKRFNFSIKNITLTWRAFPNKSFLQMTPIGMTNYQNGTFRIKSSHFFRKLIISKTGRMRFGV